MGCNCGGSRAPAKPDPCTGIVQLPTNSHGPETLVDGQPLASAAINNGLVKIYVVYSRSVTMNDFSVFDSISNQQIAGAVRTLDDTQLASPTGLNFRFVPITPCDGAGCITDGKSYTVTIEYTDPCIKTQHHISWQFHT